MFTRKEYIQSELYEDIRYFAKGASMKKTSASVSVDSHFNSGLNVVLAIDLGGTNLRIGVVNESGEVIQWKKQPTPKDHESIVQSIHALVEDELSVCTASGYNVTGIGISTGGRVDFKRGIIVDSTSLISGWKNIPLKEIIERRFNLPAFVDNDGNCFAFAEKRFGKGKLLDNFIAVVLGTGIGGGIYVDGRLLRGSNNFASEIGHISVDADGPQCSCGGRGCIELFASGSGIARWASVNPLLQHLASDRGELSSKIISEAAKAGDPSASALLKEAGWRLGVAMAGLVNVFNPESIIISGSLLELEHTYLDEFKKTVMQIAMKSNTRELRIDSSYFPQEGGILGAAALAFEEVSIALNIKRPHDIGLNKG
jgi:glucokinase-like ROK family protein